VSASGPAVGDVLDDAGDLVSAVVAPWAGLLWLSGVPLRLAQAHFAARILELGDEAHAYGNYLDALAVAVGLALLVSLWGRAVYVRACVLRLRTLEPGGLEPLRLPPQTFLTYVYAALAIEAAFYATLATVVTVPALVVVAGLAAATAPLIERPGLVRPFRLITSSAHQAGPLVGLLLAFVVAFLLAAVNLFILCRLGLWLADGVLGFNLTRWGALLGHRNPRFILVVLAGAWLLIEPWWLAALVVYVHRLRSRASGEDLRLWFGRIRSAQP
jgi:hypothetical protein